VEAYQKETACTITCSEHIYVYPCNFITLVMNPGGCKSGTGTPYSVSEAILLETDKLLRIAAEEDFGKRKQAALMALACYKIE
jgi:hypothetical protein